MAYQQVYTFNLISTGCDYYVMVDFENGLTDALSDCFGFVTVTAEELGMSPGDDYAIQCVGTTKIKAKAQLEFPYVYLESDVNSADCGYVVPSCAFTFDIETTDASNGNNNGSITITNISESGMYQYSLDNAIWQESPVFNFLFPGTYNVYVRRKEDGCVKNGLTEVSNVTIPDVLPPNEIPYEYSNRMCFFFRLIIGGVTHSIREPIKWDDVQIEGERDAEFHGYQFKHTDGNVSLGFDCDSGRELIEAVYNLDGQDGEVLFQFGYTYLAVDYVLFNGKLTLNTYKWFPDRIECTVESQDIDTAFTSRLETKVSMKQSESFDGYPVPAPTPYSIELHAKEILTKVLCNSIDKTHQSFSYTSPSGTLFYIKPDNLENTFSEIEDYYQYPLGGQVSNPVSVEEYILDFQTNGDTDISIELDHDITLTNGPLGLSDNFTAKVMYVKKKYNIATASYVTTETDITETPVSENFPGGLAQSVTFNIRGTITETDTFLAQDTIYIYILITLNQSDVLKFNITQNVFSLDVQHLEASEATEANGWFIEDVIQHCINCIGNNDYSFRSSYFQRANAIYPFTDGCGSKYLLTNGFQIRQFDVDNRPLKIDLRKVLRSLNAIHCIGYNYTNDDSGSHVRVERADYFYKEVEILSITELEDYREEVAIDIIYNQLDFGYNKFQDSGFNSLDEFNTKQEWLTAIKKTNKKLPQLSDFITSGYSIEQARREQFKDKPSSSVTNDEEPFLISVKREDAADWSTEKNEAFQTVTGIISPSTAYNLRVSPTRMLYNWFIWLKGIFAYKTGSDKITNTFVAQNNDLVTRFNTDETCRVGDENRSVIPEANDILLSEMNSTRNIYRPERIFIKCRLTPTQVQTINLAMTGRYGEEKDYGYIMVYKPTGVWEAFWLQKLSYNFATEKAELSGLKLYDPPYAPDTEECCVWLAINDCYLLVNGNKIVA
ncbi:MAG: hypothetical protein JNK14_05845 [Chitinophagaceae bacterium]|nr:hypothetical protein [Chitinophagaceae bacterium]